MSEPVMSEPIVSVRRYVLVLIALVLLTVLTVAISFAPLAGHWHIVAGLSIGAVKASLVGLFFMHLIHSRHLNWIVVAASVFWILILFSLIFADYLIRGFIPHMPGH